MFKIDRSLVNLADMPNMQANIEAGDDPKNIDGENRHSKDSLEIGAEREEQLKQIFAEAEKEAENILKQATIEAELKIQEAQIAAREIESRAWNSGYVEGKDDAEKALAQQLQEGAARIKQLILEIERARDEMFDEYETEFVQLSLAVAKKIVNVAIKKDDTVFDSMIKRALQQMKREGKIIIRVSSGEYEQFFSSGSATFVLGDESVTATILDDPAMAEGGCIIESEGQTINTGVDSQINYITLAFGQADGQGQP